MWGSQTRRQTVLSHGPNCSSEYSAEIFSLPDSAPRESALNALLFVTPEVFTVMVAGDRVHLKQIPWEQ